MKNIIAVLVLLAGIAGGAEAQVRLSGGADKSGGVAVKPKKYPLDWHLLSYSTDSVYGMEVNLAYDFLKGKEKKKKVIVAVIDSGCDDLHEDLHEALWVNKGEVPDNGMDDDGNGYVDDVHGWNFLANGKGVEVQKLMESGAREFLKKKDRIDQLHSKKRNAKEDREYRELRSLLMMSELGVGYTSYLFTGQMLEKFRQEVIPGFEKQYTPEQRTQDNFMKWASTIPGTDTLMRYTHMVYSMRWQMLKGQGWNKIVENCVQLNDAAKRDFDKLMAVQVDERHLVGDHPEDFKDNHYGTPVLSATSAGHGTHVGSIIGAIRENGMGMDGLADVQLMFIRIGAETGDEYDKDVALAIRYAVDNGADIINMSFGKRTSDHQKWVEEALKYAEKKGVLMVHEAGNNFMDIDVQPFYPVRNITPDKVISSFITVGASDRAGNPIVFSNYGRNTVDVFAPGQDIYGAAPGDNYKKQSGTDYAAPMVTGLAALVMTYYPQLSANELKELILASAVQNRGAVVPKPHDPNLAGANEMIKLEELCKMGGIVSAYLAVQLAEKRVNK